MTPAVGLTVVDTTAAARGSANDAGSSFGDDRRASTKATLRTWVSSWASTSCSVSGALLAVPAWRVAALPRMTWSETSMNFTRRHAPARNSRLVVMGGFHLAFPDDPNHVGPKLIVPIIKLMGIVVDDTAAMASLVVGSDLEE
jgi:hypothetical protein